MYHLQIENIVKTLWHNEDHFYILEKEGDLGKTPEAPQIENFVFHSQIHLLVQIAFCQRGRKKNNSWLYLLFHNVKVHEAICYDQLYQMLFANQQRLHKQKVYYLLPLRYFQ